MPRSRRGLLPDTQRRLHLFRRDPPDLGHWVKDPELHASYEVLRFGDAAADRSCGKRDVCVLGTTRRGFAGDDCICHGTLRLTGRGARNHASYTRHMPRSGEALRCTPELIQTAKGRLRARCGRGEQVCESKGLDVSRQRRCPVGFEGKIRLRVGGNDAVKHLGHDASADASELIAGMTGGRLSKNVEPERRLAFPAVASEVEAPRSVKTSTPSKRATASPRGVRCPGHARGRVRPASGRPRRRFRR